VRRGEVHWVYFPPSGSGSEIHKTRPAVIVTNDAAIGRVARVQVIPLTSNVARRFAGEALVVARGRRSKAVGSQIATVDAARLLGYFDTLSAADLAAVDDALRDQLAL
jgi:mRNA interferase MazF